MTVEHDVVEELRDAGLTPTSQRRIVLGVLEGRERPASASEIHEQLWAAGHRIGLTTVYRTLHALTDAGLLHTFHRDGEQTYRHCRYGPHHHLVCKECGLVIESPTDTAARLLEHLRTEADFVPDPQRTDLHGVCGACRRGTRCHHRPGGNHHERS